jgi:hypothetical protein
LWLARNVAAATGWLMPSSLDLAAHLVHLYRNSTAHSEHAMSPFHTPHLAGSFKLDWGKLTPFLRGSEPRFMLVSDIDGTMIGSEGDGAAAYASSGRFRNYWDNGPSLCGSTLVYNTGRSIGAVRAFV